MRKREQAWNGALMTLLCFPPSLVGAAAWRTMTVAPELVVRRCLCTVASCDRALCWLLHCLATHRESSFLLDSDAHPHSPTTMWSRPLAAASPRATHRDEVRRRRIPRWVSGSHLFPPSRTHAPHQTPRRLPSRPTLAPPWCRRRPGGRRPRPGGRRGRLRSARRCSRRPR